ncbi:unnamed protein product [Ceratitis capitata]|uniref:(Mediterranean fruit fly) hypothetical protein n=1 Tax=Ceratitis capitata TaxID=7213 RepID=A0A811UQB9_CERCA|nr:unnamed protein product [Ceratitis capitata]
MAVQKSSWPHLRNLALADGHCAKPGPIDVLIGMDEMDTFLRTGFCKVPTCTAVAQKTISGWVLFGKAMRLSNSNTNLQSPYCDVQLINMVLQPLPPLPLTAPPSPSTNILLTEQLTSLLLAKSCRLPASVQIPPYMSGHPPLITATSVCQSQFSSSHLPTSQSLLSASVGQSYLQLSPITSIFRRISSQLSPSVQLPPLLSLTAPPPPPANILPTEQLTSTQSSRPSQTLPSQHSQNTSSLSTPYYSDICRVMLMDVTFQSFMVTQKNDLCFEQVILTAQKNLDTPTEKI